MKKSIIFLIAVNVSIFASVSGKKVFETYCWGCHHQTSEAFGPPFEQIAAKRNSAEIRAMIADPKGVSKIFGYKRNAMPSFTLKEEELKAITEYILSYKPKETNSTKSDLNATKESK